MTKSSKLKKQGGFLISLELIFIATCMLCAVVLGWGALGGAIAGEFADLGGVVADLDQSGFVTGGSVVHPADGTVLAQWNGSEFGDFNQDGPQDCDVIIVPFESVPAPPAP